MAAGNSNPQGIADPPSPMPAAAIHEMASADASRATESTRVMAVDDYLTSELDQHAGRRTESLANSVVDALFGVDQRRAKIGAFKQSLR